MTPILQLDCTDFILVSQERDMSAMRSVANLIKALESYMTCNTPYYDYRFVIYDRRASIRLATDINYVFTCNGAFKRAFRGAF